MKTMMKIFKPGILLSAVALTSYALGVSFGAVSSKKTVSVYDLKQAISALIDDVALLRKQVNILSSEVFGLKRELDAVRNIHSKPQQAYIHAKRKGEWCLTNLGYIHCSLLEVKNGNQVR